jgi:shikimate dehydrogenase
VFGWPVGHSLSPVIHNAAFREHGLDLVYLALPCPPEELAAVVRAFGVVGGVGANVTVPHKQTVLPLCDRLTPEAELVGAVNTLVWDADGLLGDNTDAVGLADALAADVSLRAGDRLLVLGTGGAARAVAVAAARLGCGLDVIGRRPDAAEQIAELGTRAGAGDPAVIDLADDRRVGQAVADAAVVVNATPLGLDGETLPRAFQHVGAGQVAYDLLYPRGPLPPGAEPTPFLQVARANGAATFHGLGMLIGQAAAAYRRWTGRPAPVDTMSAAALAAIAQR